MLQDSNDVAGYILEKYGDVKRIVEIGIGCEDSVFNVLKKNDRIELIAVDASPKEKAMFDNVFEPDMSIYTGAGLLYTIRPSPEMIPPIRRIAERVGADLIIRPLSTDSCHKPAQMKLVNHGKTALWVEEVGKK